MVQIKIYTPGFGRGLSKKVHLVHKHEKQSPTPEYKLGMVASTCNSSLLKVVGAGRHLQPSGHKSIPRFSEMQHLRGVRKK